MSLTRLADTAFLQKKRNERERTVQDAMFIEDFEGKGLTSEDIKQKARRVLEIEDDESVLMEAENKLKKQNVETQAFISLVKSLSDLRVSGIVEEDQLKVLSEAESNLAQKIASRLGVEVDRLYQEEKVGE